MITAMSSNLRLKIHEHVLCLSSKDSNTIENHIYHLPSKGSARDVCLPQSIFFILMQFLGKIDQK